MQGQRGDETKDQTNKATNAGSMENQFERPTPCSSWSEAVANTLPLGGGPLPECGDQSGNVDYFAVSPKLGVIWRVAPAVEVFGNISNAYEPPLILELTAPGQIGGDLDNCKPKNRGNLSWAHAGSSAHVWPGTSRSTISSCGMRL